MTTWGSASSPGWMSSIRNRHKRITGDIYINPASQEIYADFYNGMLGTDLTWEEIFAQTDRDINLQRVMNVMRYGDGTGLHGLDSGSCHRPHRRPAL